MAEHNVYNFRLHTCDVSVIDCQRQFDWTQLVVAASSSNRNRELESEIPAQSAKGEEKEDSE